MGFQNLTASRNRTGKFTSTREKLWRFYSLPKTFDTTIDKGQGSFIVFVMKGNFKIVVNGVEVYFVESKEMFLIREDFSYTIEVLKQSQIMVCLFQAEVLLSQQASITELLPLCDSRQGDFVKLPTKDAIISFLTLLQIYIRDNINSDYFYELKRRELFSLLFHYYSKTELAQFLLFIIGENIKFKEFIINNYCNAKNVRELAMLANYSTSGFIKKFQKCFNDSPYEWMQKQRAKQIFIEIKQGVKSLQEIAVEYKFSSYQHFSNFCKRQLGFPPTKMLN
jgi:AraC-like DNA-binding protein